MKYKIILFIVMILISSVYAEELEPGKLWINDVFIPYNIEVEEKAYDASISIATLKDIYKVGEKIELTDPPDISFSGDKISSNVLNNIAIDKDEGNFDYDASVQEFVKLSTEESQVPNYKGYIIEFKEKPVLEKKAELDEKAKKNGETSASLTKVAIVGPLLSKTYDTFALQEEDIQGKVEDYRKEIDDLHSTIKQKLLSELNKKEFVNKITGNIIAEQKYKLEVLGEYKTAFNGIALDISDDEAEKLKKVSEVKEVYPNYEVHATLMDSAPLINADDVWQLDEDGNDCSVSGKDCLTGEGITIAIIDTGVDYTHPDLGGCFGVGCKVIGGYDLVNNDNNPIDDMGHGTHVAATAAGDGDWDNDGIVETGEGLNGVAPDAKIYAIKVLNSGGSGSWNTVIGGIERAVDPNQDRDFSDKADIISMSLGGPGNPDDPISQAVDNVVDAGVIAVIAAGNSGPRDGTIGSPGTARKAITVGASDKSNLIAYFSSKGPVIWEDEGGNEKIILKPDIVAPGVDICAAQYDSAWEDRKCFDDNHVAISGTSMATPHVAGAVALIKQAHPDWTPDEIKAALKNTAVDIGKEINTQGYGRIDILGAVDLDNHGVVKLIFPEGTVSGKININAIINISEFSEFKIKIKGFENPSWQILMTSDILPSTNKLYELDTTTFDNGLFMLKLEAITKSNNIFSDVVIFRIKNFYITRAGNSENYMVNQEEDIYGKVEEGEYSKYRIEIKIENEWQTVIEYSDSLKTGNIGTIITDSFEDNAYEIRVVAYTNDGKEIKSEPFWFIILKRLREGELKETELYFPFNNQLIVEDMDDDGLNEIIFKAEKGQYFGKWYTVLNNQINIFKDFEPFKKMVNDNSELSCGYDSYSIYNNDNLKEIIVSNMPPNPQGNNCLSPKLGIFDKDLDYKQGWPFETPGDEFFEYQGTWYGWNVPILFSNTIVFKTTRYFETDNYKTFGSIDTFRIFENNGNLLNEITINKCLGDEQECYNFAKPIALSDENLGFVIYINTIKNDLIINSLYFEVYDKISDKIIKSQKILEVEGDDSQMLYFPNAIASGDINNDGSLEAIFSISYVNLTLYNENSGDNNAYVSNFYVVNNQGDVIEDWKIKGKLAKLLVLGKDNNNKMFVAAQLGGTWASAGDVVYIFDFEGNILKQIEIPDESIFFDVHVLRIGDLDNDGDKELIIATRPRFYGEEYGKNPSNIYIYDLNGKLESIIIIPSLMDVEFIRDVVIGDSNNDGKIDLTVLTEPFDSENLVYGFGKLYRFDFPYYYDESTMDWPMFMHDPQHTGNYHFKKEVRPQSKIVNNEDFDLRGYLHIYIEKYLNDNWNIYKQIWWESFEEDPRVLHSKEILKLDGFFNSQDIAIKEPGKYRVVAELRDKNNKVIKTKSGELRAEWEFEVK